MIRSYDKELKSHYFLLTEKKQIIETHNNLHNITTHHNFPKVKEKKKKKN